MRRSIRATFQAILLTLSGAGIIVAAAARPYVIVTHDGHRFFAESRPRVQGLEAYVRLLPGRQLAVIKEELIDWKLTEEANAHHEPIAIPVGSTFVEKNTSPNPIIHTIVGKPSPVNLDAAQSPGDAMQVQYASLIDQRERHTTRRTQLVEDLRMLEAAGPAAAGGGDERASRVNELRRMIDEVEQELKRVNAAIASLEKEAAIQGVTLKQAE